DAFPLRVDLDGVFWKFRAHDTRDAVQPPFRVIPDRWKFEDRTIGTGERETNGREGDGRAPDHIAGGSTFCPLPLHEFQPCRGGEKQVAHLHYGSPVCRSRPYRRHAAALDGDLGAAIAVCRARAQRQPGDRTDRGQSFPAESQRVYGVDVVRKLRGAVSRDGERQFRCRNTHPVVSDADQAETAARRDDLDVGSAGIERVLNQFFDDAGRTLDDLAGGDLVDHRFGKLEDRHVCTLAGFACQMQPMRCNGYEIAGIGPGHGPRAKTEEKKLQRLLAFVALLVVAGPACAGPASDAVKFFYLPEVKVESDPQYRSRFTEPVTKLFALNDEAQRKNPDQLACIDFAPALDAQDFDQKIVSRTLNLTETRNGDEVTVIATFD